MKKLFSLILTGTMVLSMAACSDSSSKTSQSSASGQSSQSSFSASQPSEFTYPAGDINWELPVMPAVVLIP